MTRPPRPAPASLVIALAIGLSQAALGCNFADTVLLWPPSGPAATNGATRRVASADGKEIEIWATPPASGRKPAAYILRFYGNGDRADFHTGEESAQFPDASIWGVNYPGYGGSHGPATLRGVAAGAVASYDVRRRSSSFRAVRTTAVRTATRARRSWPPWRE